MEVGDKIVCILTNGFKHPKGKEDRKKVTSIEKGGTYTIKRFGPSDDIVLEEVEEEIFFHKMRFVTLVEARNMKINHITEKWTKRKV